ncbi:MAG: protein kinase [Planctomycetaceae bacterium]|nr:protein kinase [Planctomycetaceae bacterium]
MVTSHYDDDALTSLLTRQSVEADERLLQHVETCERCQTRLEELSCGDLSWDEVATLLADCEDGPSDDTRDDWLTSRLLEPSEYPQSQGRFARYEIMEMLGRGGMGVVMRGYDTSLNRHSAVKVLVPELASSAAARQRFSREARSAAAVVHPHVVAIHTVDEHNGLPYLVMPVLEGNSVEVRVRESGPLPPLEAVRIAAQVAGGLAAAHEQGLVHRDIKPANILLGNGVERVQITDFGLARAIDDAHMTRSGVIAGTPQYMSPEQAHGDAIDHRSDLFSLGSLMYFMLTGRSPFRAETTMGVLNRIANDTPRSLRSINPDVPDWLEDIVSKLLQKRPDVRFQTAAEVSELLDGWLAHLQQPATIAPPQMSQPTDFEQRRNLLTGAALGLLAWCGWFVFGGNSVSGKSEDTPGPEDGAAAVAVVPAAENDEDQEPPVTGLPDDQRIKWSAHLGSTTMRAPVISGGQVYVGTNNENAYIKRYPKNVDLGVLLCFRQSDGEFLWQHSNPKTRTGREHDWPMMGVTSRPCVEGDRLWYITNRAEIVCLDTAGFRDGENDGPVTDEPHSGLQEADIIWRLDMMKDLGVRPHNVSTCTIAVWQDRLFAVTGNGVGESHAPPVATAPSFLALDKHSGKVLWRDNSPGQNVLHGQWGSPTVIDRGADTQIVFPGGDGWLYSFSPFAAADGKAQLLWKFDCNHKESVWKLGGQGTRNNLLHGPTLFDNRLYIATGQDPEHGSGQGRVLCLEIDGAGDVSSHLVYNESNPKRVIAHRRTQACRKEDSDFTVANEASALVWSFEQQDVNNDGELDIEERMSRSLSTISIKDDLLFVSDIEGVLHCLDRNTGRQHWGYDTFSGVYSTPQIIGDLIYLGTEDGEILVFRAHADRSIAAPGGKPVQTLTCESSVNASVMADGLNLFYATKNRLIAIEPVKQD